jgi:signal transduction histidine kinase
MRRAAAARLAVDAVIALAATAAQVGGTYAAGSWHHEQAPAGPLAYAALTIGGAALIARRRYPVAVLATTLITALLAATAGAGMIYAALIVAFFNAILARKRAAAIASLVIGYLAAVWPPWRIGRDGGPDGGFALGLAAGLFLMLSVAEIIRSRTQRVAALARSREEQVLRQAGEERMRIARDLHDVVAHNIAVINVQANTALHLMDRQPERARSALTAINDVSKQALVELRSVLGVLRGADEDSPLAPAPGLARLGDLADNAAAAGLTVSIRETGQPATLPADVDLAAYRIIQEALTNSARHSGGTVAAVRLAYTDGALDIEVADDGPAQPPARSRGQYGGGSGGDGSGSGIVGMTERAQALGGSLSTGQGPGGGFVVRARLPLERNQG